MRRRRPERLKPQGWLVVGLIATLAVPGGRTVLVDAVTSDAPAAVAKAAAKGHHKAKPKTTVAGVTCKTLPVGIRHQESGGNRAAVSSLGAIGPDQIMPGNVGPWSKEAIGRAVSVEEFRRSPALQDRVGRFKIGQYCEAYGPRGAAAAWYSGNPSRDRDYRPIPNRSGPSVGAYVDSVMTLARRYG